jgi:hypothetical protein
MSIVYELPKLNARFTDSLLELACKLKTGLELNIPLKIDHIYIRGH